MALVLPLPVGAVTKTLSKPARRRVLPCALPRTMPLSANSFAFLISKELAKWALPKAFAGRYHFLIAICVSMKIAVAQLMTNVMMKCCQAMVCLGKRLHKSYTIQGKGKILIFCHWK